MLFILDVTGSMNTIDPGNSKSRLELAKEAINATALKYFNATGDADVRFELATFGATGVVHGATWMTYAQLGRRSTRLPRSPTPTTTWVC